MVQETMYKGVWWLPNEPERKVPGELSVASDKEARLELQGSLKDESFSNSSFSPALLLGDSNSGKITLYKCFSTQLTHSTFGISESHFRANFVFVGVHFETEEQIHFKSLSINYAHLDEWVDRRAFEYEPSDKDRSFIIRYKQSAPVEAKVGDYQITVRPSYSMRRSAIDVDLKQTAWVDLSSEKERPFNEYLEISRRVQDFLSLGMGTPTRPLEVFGQTEYEKRVFEDGKEFLKPIEIHYQAIGWSVDVEEVHSYRMPFTLAKIQERFEACLGNWISNADLLAPVYNLFFAALYNPHQYLESNFLTLVQALETYHRRRFGGQYQTDKEYQEGLYQIFVEKIPEELDKGFRQALVEGKLKYANEFSLRKRLHQLSKRLSSYVSMGFLRSKTATETFVERVCHTRNYLTHYTPELRDRSAEGEELYLLSQQLRGVLEMCLFEEIGLDPETIKKIVSQNNRYMYLLK